MRFHALATDYDGTIAHDGKVEAETIAALERAKKSGRKLILVTGRELPDLLSTFDRIDLFHLAVMENGATIYDPVTKETRVLADPPPAKFAETLRARGVSPLSVGDVIVATFEPHEKTVFGVIHELGLELQVVFNKGAVMVLPSGVNKATGLAAALTELGLSPHNAVGVGDAENDHAFLKVCECSVAVANALPAVKDTADVITRGARGAGVAELIDELLASDLTHLKTLARHRFPIGLADNEAEAGIDPAGTGVMVCGTSGSGKSTITTAILEHLADAGYQSLVIDPEGDYTNLDFATHVGSTEQAPRPEDVTGALADPKRSVVVNLLGVPLGDRPAFFRRLLPRINEVKAGTGRPHWLVIDEAHHLLPGDDTAASVADQLPDRGMMFVTVHAGSVDPAALANVGTLLVIGGQPAEAVAKFCAATGEKMPKCPTVGGDKLPTGDALLWRRGEPAATVVHTKAPRTERKRHKRKYAAGNLGPERSFYFRGPKDTLNLKAPNLFQFLQLADGVDDETWEYHRRRGDYSKWVRTEMKDNQLADELVAIEADRRATPKDTRAAVRAAVEARYTLPADEPSGKIDQ
ncbi:HAD family hydrolase [Frigoriglobus tundricola]|uniref:Hydrolase, HAD superfamily n=1 Tax=Frigoriglobus tundricola TaxID=2774151 RepID=A0A6M5YRP0_9BACT|nr:HAD-IIB family hydrolase [Frigoriglobus tundricola]QJW96094.1 Hydrolase, HAD superfamily [Frigoriglobus tundricola]